ncbi:MAG: hypothetical protein EOM14_12685 [Clostridia bacterium]|nr:hypothetical protein [Clostridia bacterium]
MRTFLKFVIILLAAVLILAVLALVFLQQYIVYSADGIHLELPFLQNGAVTAAPTGSPEPAETEPLVVLTPQVIEPDWLHAVTLPREALYDGTAQQRITEAGGNAAVFDMKGDDGSLGYVSGLPLAVSAKVSSGDAAINAAIRALNEKEIYTIARVSCFKDHNLSNADRSLAVTTNSGYRWTDPDGVRWVSPTNETVRQYMADVCVELAQLGFDEILLVSSGYPAEGNLNYIKKGNAYDKAVFSTVINGFYAQIAAALEEYGTKLSILTDGATVMEGKNMLSGQTTDSLVTYADRIWVLGQEQAAAQILKDAGLAEENIVPMTEERVEVASSWALLNIPTS